MKYIKKDLGSYNLHIIKTKKFSSVNLLVSFKAPIKKEETTIRNILSGMLMMSNAKYKTKRDISLRGQDLYASKIVVDSTRYGNYMCLDFSLNVLLDKYTEEGNLSRAIEFLKDIIYQPDVKDSKFNQENLDIVKEHAITILDSIKEDSDKYSAIRLFENMDKNRVNSYRVFGYKEDLENINTNNLYVYYQNLIKTNILDIYVIGDVDYKEIEKIITKQFVSNTYKTTRANYFLDEVKPRLRKKIVIEKDNLTQSKLAIGCRMNNLTKLEKNYALTLYAIILGASPDSKLFKVVREQNSAAYYISSIPNKLDNTLLIRAGISKENFKKVVKLVEQQMNEMRKGNFDINDINTAKELYNTGLEEIEESPSKIILAYYMTDITGIDNLSDRKKLMSLVTKEDIISVAKKIKIDTVYCLEGDNNEK